VSDRRTEKVVLANLGIIGFHEIELIPRVSELIKPHDAMNSAMGRTESRTDLTAFHRKINLVVELCLLASEFLLWAVSRHSRVDRNIFRILSEDHHPARFAIALFSSYCCCVMHMQASARIMKILLDHTEFNAIFSGRRSIRNKILRRFSLS
jgi:hypothetical protein